MRARILLCAVLFTSILGTHVQAQSIYALEGVGGANLVKFSASDPTLTSSTAITGVSLLGTLVAIDFRPATGELYALGYSAVTSEIQLYTIDTVTAVATPVGSASTLTLGAGGNTGFDFNPTVDRIRVISELDSNYRLNPITGLVAATDVSVAYAVADVNAGSNPDITAVAYTNSYDSALTTTLYAYDSELDVLVSVVPPNNGTLNTISGSGRDFSVIDMDISASNMAYLVGRELGGNDSLYVIDLASGSLTPVNTIGSGLVIQDIAVWISGDAPVGIASAPNNIEVAIYPNPTTDKVNVTLGVAISATTTVKVTDVAGKLVYSKQLKVGDANALTIDVSSYAPGTYYISIENTTGRTVKPISKQ